MEYSAVSPEHPFGGDNDMTYEEARLLRPGDEVQHQSWPKIRAFVHGLVYEDGVGTFIPIMFLGDVNGFGIESGMAYRAAPGYLDICGELHRPNTRLIGIEI